MSLVASHVSKKDGNESLEALVLSLQKQLSELKDEMGPKKRGPKVKTRVNTRQRRPIIRPWNIHIFEPEDDDNEDIRIALIEGPQEETAHVIKLSKEGFDELAIMVNEGKLKTAVHLKNYELMDDMAIKVGNEWMVSEA